MSGSLFVDRRAFVGWLGSGLLYLAGCGGGGPTGGGGGGGGNTGGGGGDGGGNTGGGGGSADIVVEMINTSFRPQSVTIQLGETVGWINRDNLQHDPASTDVPAGGNAFNSPSLSNGQTFTFTPNVRGTWVYRCNIHPVEMRDATIIVE